MYVVVHIVANFVLPFRKILMTPTNDYYFIQHRFFLLKCEYRFEVTLEHQHRCVENRW